jgi:hypothetical protein
MGRDRGRTGARNGKSCGGVAEEHPGGDSSGGPGKLDEAYWLKLWAFGTAPDGLGLSSDAFWRLTPREYYALRAVHQEARGIKPELTPAQQFEIAEKERYIRGKQLRAHNLSVQNRKLRLVGRR